MSRRLNDIQTLQKEISLKSIFDSVLIGIMVIDKDCVIQTANKTCLDLLGITDDNSSDNALIDILDAPSGKKLKKQMEGIESKGIDTNNGILELKVSSKNKGYRPIELNITSRMLDSDDAYIALVHDISKRKELEIEVKKQQHVREEVEEELHREQELNEMKSRFVSMASHEFRTPLAGILSSVNLIKRYLDAESTNGAELEHLSKIESHFEKITSSVRNLTQILNEFLSLDKLEAGQVNCIEEPVHLKSLLDSAVEELEKLCKSGQTLKVEFQEDPELLMLDHNMMLNIINNLVTNAIKYSPENSPIHIRIKLSGEQLILEIEDHGIGIPESERKNLFQRFFRAGNATNIQGTGLGLSIVKKYIEMLAGEIEFTSELGKGTTFTVKIPRKNAD